LYSIANWLAFNETIRIWIEEKTKMNAMQIYATLSAVVVTIHYSIESFLYGELNGKHFRLNIALVVAGLIFATVLAFLGVEINVRIGQNQPHEDKK
jgi:hypothetical protein